VWLPGTTRPATTRSVGPPDPDNLSRLCLALDATGYSNRAVLDQKAVQARLLRLSLALLADIGVDIGLVRQDAGDGTTLVLPPDVDPVRALPILLDRIAEHLLADNRDHADRIRLRVALAFGPVPHGDLGWIGQTVIETHRMLDSEQLRTHLDLDPESDLAVVLSSILYDLYVSPNFGTISPDAFTQEAIVHKKYQKPAWIWRRQRSA
jgi:class 3 adenylate cyclase